MELDAGLRVQQTHIREVLRISWTEQHATQPSNCGTLPVRHVHLDKNRRTNAREIIRGVTTKVHRRQQIPLHSDTKGPTAYARCRALRTSSVLVRFKSLRSTAGDPYLQLGSPSAAAVFTGFVVLMPIPQL